MDARFLQADLTPGRLNSNVANMLRMMSGSKSSAESPVPSLTN